MSKRVTIAGLGDLHGQSGTRTGKTVITDPDTRKETTYTTVRLDGEGHDRPLPEGNVVSKGWFRR